MAEARVTFVVEGGQELRTVLDEISRSTAKINGETAKMEQATARATTQMKSEAAAANQDAQALTNQATATTASGTATKKHIGYSDQLTKSFERKLFGARGTTNAMFKLGAAITGVGIGIPALISAFSSLITNAIESEKVAREQAAAFIQTSEAMKQAEYGAIGYKKRLDDIIKSNREIGLGIALTGEKGGGGRVNEMVSTAVANLTEQMAAQGKSHEEITKAIRDNKSRIEDYATATEAAAEAQRELDAVTGDDVVSMMKRKVLEEALQAALARQKDTMSAVSDAFGGLVPAINSLQSWFYNLQNKLGREAATIPGMTYEESTKIFQAARRRAKPAETKTGSSAAQKVQVPVPGGMDQVMAELPGYEAEQGRLAYGSPGIQQTGQRGKVEQEKVQELQDFATQVGAIFTGLADEIGQSMGDAMGRIIVDGEKGIQVFDEMGKTIAKSILGQAMSAITALIVKMTVLLGIALAINAIPGGSAILKMMGISIAGYKKLGIMGGGGYNTGLGWIPAADGFMGNINSPTLIPGMGGPPVLAGERGRELMMILNQQQEQNLMNLVGRGLTAQQQVQSGPTIYTSAYLGGDDMPRRIKNSHLQGQVQQEAARI